MSTALRQLSPRPTLLLDALGRRVADLSAGVVGVPGPFGRFRLVAALPFAQPPRQLVKPLVVHDTLLGYLADPNGNLIGVPGIWAGRVIDARWTENTRGIAG
jgi:hypothetical protein